MPCSSPSSALSRQERQSIIRFWLQNLRAKQGEALHNVRFLEDQPISEQGGANPPITGRELGRPLRDLLWGKVGGVTKSCVANELKGGVT